MDLGTLIGLVLGFGLIATAMMIGGGWRPRRDPVELDRTVVAPFALEELFACSSALFLAGPWAGLAWHLQRGKVKPVALQRREGRRQAVRATPSRAGARTGAGAGERTSGVERAR